MKIPILPITTTIAPIPQVLGSIRKNFLVLRSPLRRDLDKMYATGFLLAMLLALHGLAAGSALSADTCCKANFTIAFTSTITMTIPETTVLAYGNPTFAAGISTTSAHVATTAFASGSLSSHHSLASAVHSTAANVTGTDAVQSMPASSLGSVTLVSLANTVALCQLTPGLSQTNTTEICTTGASAFPSGGYVNTTLVSLLRANTPHITYTRLVSHERVHNLHQRVYCTGSKHIWKCSFCKPGDLVAFMQH